MVNTPPSLSFAEILRTLNPRSEGYSSTKLTGTLRDKTNYTLHYLNLKMYLEAGMILKKVSKVVSFDQAPFVKDWIGKLALMRSESTSEQEKQILKLFSVSLFGKTLESARKYFKMVICLQEDHLRKTLSSPFYDRHKIISDRLVLVMMKPASIVISKPIAVGVSILEHAKRRMFELYYKHLLPAVAGGNKHLKIILSDTDSFVFELRHTTPAQFFSHPSVASIVDHSSLLGGTSLVVF